MFRPIVAIQKKQMSDVSGGSDHPVCMANPEKLGSGES